MGQQIELVPLVCLRCSQPIPAQGDEVAWVCSQCGQGMRLDEAHGLESLEVSYNQGLNPGQTGRPFWVADGAVTNLVRNAYRGNESAAAQAFWAQPRRFFIPAYECRLEELLQAGSELLLNPPALQNGPAGPFAPVTLPAENLAATAEFIVMAVEAGRKDQLKECHFQLTLSPPVLWILP